MNKINSEYRPDIDGLRALSVIIVILFHLDARVVPGGFVGVDVFFVISGFLITSIIIRKIESGNFSLIDFYERRFRRIYPNLIVVILTATIVGWFILMAEPYRDFARSLVLASISASNFAFLSGNGYFDPASITKPLLHTWSLGVEEQFYILFPCLLVLAVRRGCRPIYLISSLVAISLGLSITAAMANWSKSYFLLPTRFWELGLGSLIAIVPARGNLTPGYRSIIGLTGAAAVLWASLSISESDNFPGYLALVPTLGAAMLIIANGGLVNRFLSLPPFTWLGHLSFALYLWHWPLISFAARIGFPPTELRTRLFVISVSLLFSIAGYHLWEMPIRRGRYLSTRSQLFTALALSVTFIVSLGGAILVTKGFPQRLPKELADISENTRIHSRQIKQRCALANSDKPYSCPIGDQTSSHVSFLVIGDSHSEAVAAEIGDIAEKYGLRGLYMGKAGCRSFAEPQEDKEGSCAKQHEFVLKTYSKEKPELVIIVAKWTSVLNEDDQNQITDEKYKSVLSTFGNTLDAFHNSSVVTALTTPEFDVDVPEAAWRAQVRARIGLSSSPTPSVTLSDYHARQVWTAKMLSEAEGKYPNLRVINTQKYLCGNLFCSGTKDNIPMYYDNNHLSHNGALVYAKMFEGYFSYLARK